MRRLRLAATVLATLAVAAVPASAQMALSGRALGTVLDVNGRAIRGAIVKASNKDAIPSDIASAADDKGRWGMIGLRSGIWTFSVEAPGFETGTVSLPIRAGANPSPMRFVLQRTPEPIPGALVRNIDDEIARARSMRADGRLDQALAAYEAIHAKNPKLTMVNLVIGDIHKQKGDRAKAVAAYSEVVRTDPGSAAATQAAAFIKDLQQ